MNGRRGFGGNRKAKDMISERLGDRDRHGLACFAGLKPDNVSLQIEIRPGEARQITKSLASVEPEFYQRLPFWCCDL